MPTAFHMRGIMLIFSVLLLASCSVQTIAINSLSGVLAEGNSVFESDNDPDFVAEALPFSLKLIDTLLTKQPDNQGLLLAAASGYVFYGYAYLNRDSERLSLEDIDAARTLRMRARNLFLRAHDYATRALEVDYPGIQTVLFADPEAAVSAVSADSRRNVELLYWNAASLGLAISAARNDSALLARGPEVQAQLERALEIDESWDEGALHEFAISSAALTHIDTDAIERHFERALMLSEGKRASLFISYAEATALPRQERARFVDLLDRALSIDVDLYPDLRLVNTVAQQRATWLLGNLDEMFLE
jgi:predicted anti-sigma-YlaC factor YlaD